MNKINGQLALLVILLIGAACTSRNVGSSAGKDQLLTQTFTPISSDLRSTNVFTPTLSSITRTPTIIEPEQTPIASLIPTLINKFTNFDQLPVGQYIVYEKFGDSGLSIISVDKSYQGKFSDKLKSSSRTTDGRWFQIDDKRMIDIVNNKILTIDMAGILSPDRSKIVSSVGDETRSNLGFQLITLNDKRIKFTYPKIDPNKQFYYPWYWSPDSRWFTFVMGDLEVFSGREDVTETGLYFMDTNCFNTQCSSPISGPIFRSKIWWQGPFVWSPDSRYLAFLSYPTSGPILIYDLKTQQIREVESTKGLGSKNSLAWSSDGNNLAFDVEKSDLRSSIYVASVLENNNFELLEDKTIGKRLNILFTLNVGNPNDYLQLQHSYTITEAGDNLHVRKSASLRSEIIQEIRTGEKISILDGPIGHDNYLWWKIRIDENGVEGWCVDNDKWYSPVLNTDNSQ